MLTQPAASPVSDRSLSLDEMLTRLFEIERRLDDALAFAQTSCRVCEQALALTEFLRSRITEARDDPLTPQPALPQARVREQPGMPVGVGRQTHGPGELLTPREREVLDLITAGHSNRRIAEVLYLSPRTVERHIANIYLKLDVHSKAEATAWALVRGFADDVADSNGSVVSAADGRLPGNYVCRLHTSTDA
jgi:DNA-binding CsgD family transcriptional regulator